MTMLITVRDWTRRSTSIPATPNPAIAPSPKINSTISTRSDNPDGVRKGSR